MSQNLTVVDKERCREFNKNSATEETRSFMEMINKDFDFVLDPDFDDYIKNRENRVEFMKDMINKYYGHSELEAFKDSQSVESILETSKVSLDVEKTEDNFTVTINEDGEVILLLSIEMFVNQIKDMNEELKEGKDVRPCFAMFLMLFSEAINNIVYGFDN